MISFPHALRLLLPAAFTCITASAGFSQDVTQVNRTAVVFTPDLRFDIVGRFEIGVVSKGQVSTVVFDSSDISRRYSRSDAYSMRSVNGWIEERTQKLEITSRDRPSVSGLGSAVANAAAGNFEDLLVLGGQWLDYGLSPYKRHEASVYSRVDADTTVAARTRAVATADSFVNRVRRIDTTTQRYDLNAGYIRAGIRITNLNIRPVRFRNPVFSIFMKSGDDAYYVGRAAASLADTSETHTLHGSTGAATPGGMVDLELRLGSLNYPDLLRRYADSDGFILVLQRVSVEEADGTWKTIDESIHDQRQRSVRVRLRSNAYRFDAAVPVDTQGATLEEVFRRINLLQFEAEGSDGTPALLGIRRIGQEANQPANLTLAGLESLRTLDPITHGTNLRALRRWVALVHDPLGAIVSNFKLSDRLTPGMAVTLGTVRGRELYGDEYRPVVSRRPNVSFRAGPVTVSDIDLEPGDEVVLKNIRLDYVRTDSVEFVRRFNRVRCGDRLTMALRLHPADRPPPPEFCRPTRSGPTAANEALNRYFFVPVLTPVRLTTVTLQAPEDVFFPVPGAIDSDNPRAIRHTLRSVLLTEGLNLLRPQMGISNTPWSAYRPARALHYANLHQVLIAREALEAGDSLEVRTTILSREPSAGRSWQIALPYIQVHPIFLRPTPDTVEWKRRHRSMITTFRVPTAGALGEFRLTNFPAEWRATRFTHPPGSNPASPFSEAAAVGPRYEPYALSGFIGIEHYFPRRELSEADLPLAMLLRAQLGGSPGATLYLNQDPIGFTADVEVVRR